MSKEDSVEEIFLELGDIIKINSEANKELNNNTFFIDYLDENRASLVNVESMEETVLNILDGDFSDESIDSIEILSRPTEKGYARQNGLTTGAWITIQLGGEVPITINGQITNLDEDMIEITTYSDNKKLYIDFAYKGVPLSLPIENIKPFEAPKKEEVFIIPELDLSPVAEEGEEGEEEEEYTASSVNVSTHLKRVLLEADAVEFGDELGEITEFVPVKKEELRFGLETQTADLLDDLLSTIPTHKRTPHVLNKIHIMIERFKQLREMFSVITAVGVDKPNKKTANYKPLVERMYKLNQKLYWLLPIVKNKKKLYDINFDDEKSSNVDFIPTTLHESYTEMDRIINEFKTNMVPDGQNKYNYLGSHINADMMPFALPTDKNNVITQENIQSNLLAVVDNMDGFYSSVSKNENVIRKRFLLTSYDMALTRLESTDLRKTLQTAKLRNISPNDKMALIGFLMLSEPALIYSHINLPNTSILMKSQLSHLNFNYFSVLNQNASVTTTELIENSEVPDYNENTYLKDIVAVKFSQELSYDDRNNEETYKHFLENMVPKTKVLFNLVKKFIIEQGKGVSYLKIIEYLEPFLIYPDDITFKQYETIVRFIEERILILKRLLINRTTDIKQYLQTSYFAPDDENHLLEIISSKTSDIPEDILQLYHLTPQMSTSFTLNRMIGIDDMRLFSNIATMSDIDLYQPIDIENVLKKSTMESEVEEQKTCEGANLVLAKYYLDIDDLRQDDNKPDVFFDKKYDVTRYDINDEFMEQKDSMSNEEYREFLIQHLTKNVGLTEKQAMIESEALINRKRRVTENDYAYIDSDDGLLYFKRNVENVWVRDEDLQSSIPLSPKMFCNIKQNCLQIKDNCDSINTTKEKVTDDLTRDILNQFDLEFNLEYKELKEKLIEDLKYNASTLHSLRLIQLHEFIKGDLLFHKIGESLEDTDIVISPYENLRDHILAQTDFVEKQANILMFASKLCRQATDELSDKAEHQFWYYCKKTDVPLLPTFYTELADAFQRGDYKNTLERICARQGQISDDGEKIVDKYSGFVIRTIEYDTSEGYSDAGYKIVSREVLEEDIGDVLINIYSNPVSKKISPDAEMVTRVLSTMDKNMGIHMQSEYEFIIKGATESVTRYIGGEKAYNKKLKVKKAKGRKGIEYKKAHDETLILFTLAYYLVAIQSMVPAVITKKTFPGCVRSFSGFPLHADADSAAVLYLVCTILRLRQSARPWNVLPKISKKKEESVTTKYTEKIKKTIGVILKDSIVNQKLEMKREYLAHHVEIDDIPQFFDVKQWSTFLPPLYPIKMKQVANVSTSFRDVLIGAMKKGSVNQTMQLNVVRGKIIAFSFLIQELIQKVVNREAPLLKNLADEPMLENACCNEGIRETLAYFTDKENRILKYNAIVENLQEMLDIAKEYQTVNYIFSPLDTHLKYPQLSEHFSEETMYISFLKICRSVSDLSPDILQLCQHPIIQTFTSSHSIRDKISILKREGININREWFQQILKNVNKNNVIDINLHPVILSERHVLEVQITQLKEKRAPVICNPDILDAFTNLIDTFETVRKGDNESFLTMSSFLNENIEHFQSQLIDFLSSMGVTKGVKQFFNTMTEWKIRGEEIYMTQEDETSVTIFTFYNTFIKNLMHVYPNMIIKNVSYKEVKIPKHWKLSDKHNKDMKNLLFAETSSLQKFYRNKDLFPILKHIQKQSKDIIDLMDATTLFADLILNDAVAETIMNGEILNKLIKFYLLCSMYIYIKSLDATLEDENFNLDSPDLLDLVDNEGLDTSVKRQQMEGKRDQLNKKVAELLGTFITIMHNQKKKLDMNNEDIIKHVLKAKEKEKNKVTKRLGDLTVEEREVENIKKNQKLGAWSLGQTKALYEYDAMQYDKERQAIEDDMLMELRLNRNDEVTQRNREIYRLDDIQEQVQRERVNAEMMATFAAMGDDDDYGERDGDEAY
jgi:hypothetical protein